MTLKPSGFLRTEGIQVKGHPRRPEPEGGADGVVGFLPWTDPRLKLTGHGINSWEFIFI